MSNSGYLHPLYAQSLIEFGEPMELPTSKGWILKRSIPGTSYFDGMGCYPIFMCEDWSCLENDLDSIETKLVSVSLVTDPFGQYTPQELLRYFKDIARPYKEHFVVDLQRRPEEFVSGHHQRNSKKALEMVNIEICQEPIRILDEWDALYRNLIDRHNINGLTRFSRESFATQLSVPGIVAFRAVYEDRTVGILLWYLTSERGYYHLGAYSTEGYQLNASFALFWILLEYFANMGLRWLNLGAGAGSNGDGNDGLTRFKRGWSTETRTAYFCGRVFDPVKYQKIVSMRSLDNTGYFPAYRADEFT